MDKVRAKVTVFSVKKSHGNPGVEIEMYPVSADGVPENERFHRYTPSGMIKLYIDNPPAAEFFEIGKQFYVDFTAA